MPLGSLAAIADILPPVAKVASGAIIGFKMATLRASSCIALSLRLCEVQCKAELRKALEVVKMNPCRTRSPPLVQLETLLAEVQFGAGLAMKPNVTQAKTLMRAKGARPLASRLERVKPAAGHLDVGLQAAVQ